MNKFSRVVFSSLFLCAISAHADIERVSVSSNGAQGNGKSYVPSISADGQFIAFYSRSSNLVEGDINGYGDVFVHDRLTRVTDLVSVSSTGELANNGTTTRNNIPKPVLSADGRYVAFSSFASNLVEGDTNNHTDIFVHDRESGITERVNVSSSGEQGNNFTLNNPSISADGRIVAFQSFSSNLVDSDFNSHRDLFLHDRVTGFTERVDMDEKIKELLLANSTGQGPRFNRYSLSADGRLIAFELGIHDFTLEEQNPQIYVHDRESGITELVSIAPTGEPEDYDSYDPVISADGSFVTFSSRSRNLVDNDTNGFTADIFVHEIKTGANTIVSVSSAGIQGNSSSFYPSISADNRFVVFNSAASNLVAGDTNGAIDLFVYDRETGITERLSEFTTVLGTELSGRGASMSADGSFVAFESPANNLVLEDTNGFVDIFVTDNPLVDSGTNLVSVEKLINNAARETPNAAAQLATGTQYRQLYKVTNNSPNRIYQVRVFEKGNLVCNFYALNPGQSRQRCDSIQTVLDGDQHTQANVTAIVSGSGEVLTNSTDAYYSGINVTGKLVVTHRINNVNADRLDQAPTLGSSQATVLYKVENTGEIELYQVKTYHDPVSPVNSGWALQCVLGSLKPGQVRYCKRNISLTEVGINLAMGRVQGRNAIRSAADVVNASNSTYFIVP